jgi:transcriptional regulator
MIMYIPKHFSETNTDLLHDVMCTYPLATLVSITSSGIDANHLPLYFTKKEGVSDTLSGHVAKANPICHEMADGSEVLAIFHGPQAYITPSWYPSKAKTDMVVPTWNYVVVHARGTLKVIEDAKWLRTHLDLLTASQEAGLNKPWQLDDAPADFTGKLINAIAGIEIDISTLSGKWKVSQNQTIENQQGVIKGLRENGHDQPLAMATMIERIHCLRD